jgi:hypothetical protein
LADGSQQRSAPAALEHRPVDVVASLVETPAVS